MRLTKEELKTIIRDELKEAIPAGSGGFDRYFSNIERHIADLERNLKRFIKELSQEKLRKESTDLMRLYKKHLIEFKLKFENFKRRNT